MGLAHPIDMTIGSPWERTGDKTHAARLRGQGAIHPGDLPAQSVNSSQLLAHILDHLRDPAIPAPAAITRCWPLPPAVPLREGRANTARAAHFLSGGYDDRFGRRRTPRGREDRRHGRRVRGHQGRTSAGASGGPVLRRKRVPRVQGPYRDEEHPMRNLYVNTFPP